MSIREKAKKYQKKEKESQQETDHPVDSPQSVVEEKQTQPITSQPITSEGIQKTDVTTVPPPELLFQQLIPGWVNKPWMYIKPSHPSQLNSWIQGWKKLILDYCRIFVKHVINLMELQNVHPFRNQKNGKTLSLPQLTTIIDSMVDEGLAKWLDDSKILARIYYKPIDQWADEIYNYLLETGKAAEVLTFMEFRQMDTDWSSLPEEDLKLILKSFVDEGKARFVTKEEDAVEFVF